MNDRIALVSHSVLTTWHIQKVGPETRDFWQNPRPGTHHMGETRDLRPGGTLKVRPETRDSSHRWDPGPKTRGP